MNLNNPSKLNFGDTIGIVAPSAGLAELFPHRVQKGTEMLKELGFKVKFSKHALDRTGYTSGLAIDRASDINKLFADKNIKAIICTIGGEHANQILKFLDFELIRKNPKIFVGYSDITILHFALAKKSNLRTFYGPCLISEFGENPKILPYTLEYFEKALMKAEPIGKVIASKNWTSEFLDWMQKADLKRPRRLKPNGGYQWWRKGQAQAEVFGGTIPTINHLIGTEYWVDLTGKILFIDLPEGRLPGTPFEQNELDAYLADLDNIKVFSKIKGLIIGRPYCYQNPEYEELKKMIKYYTKDTNYPILYNANIGHASPIITLPMGAKVKIDSGKNEFSILEKAVL